MGATLSMQRQQPREQALASDIVAMFRVHDAVHGAMVAAFDAVIRLDNLGVVQDVTGAIPGRVDMIGAHISCFVSTPSMTSFQLALFKCSSGRQRVPIEIGGTIGYATIVELKSQNDKIGCLVLIDNNS